MRPRATLRPWPLSFTVPSWITDNAGLFWAVGIASVVIFFASLLIMPALVIRIPVDYFTHAHRPESRFADRQPSIRLLILIAKNVLGGVLVLAGIAMLVLPGQGLLTIIVGFLLVDFPRKYALERWLVRKPIVHRPINWLRRRHHREPLQIHKGDTDARHQPR